MKKSVCILTSLIISLSTFGQNQIKLIIVSLESERWEHPESVGGGYLVLRKVAMHQLIYTLDASTKKMITDHYLITTRTDLLPDDSIKHEIKTKQKNWSNQITKAAIDSLIVELQSDRDTLQENIHSHRKPNPFYNTGIIIIQEEDTTSFAKRLPFVCFPPWCTTAEKTKLQPSLDGMLEYIVPGNFIIKEK